MDEQDPVVSASEVVGTLQGKAPKRPGYSIEIDGEAFHPSHPHWSAEQRAKGVRVGFVFLNPAEENEALGLAAKWAAAQGFPLQQALLLVGASQAFVSMKTIDGVVIPEMDRETVWNALGSQGRNLCASAFSRANAMSEGASQRATASFRVEV